MEQHLIIISISFIDILKSVHVFLKIMSQWPFCRTCLHSVSRFSVWVVEVCRGQVGQLKVNVSQWRTRRSVSSSAVTYLRCLTNLQPLVFHVPETPVLPGLIRSHEIWPWSLREPPAGDESHGETSSDGSCDADQQLESSSRSRISRTVNKESDFNCGLGFIYIIYYIYL